MTELDKTAIKRMVLKLRHFLEEDITAVLRQYGLFADRDWLPVDRVRPQLREARDRMEATMLPEVERIGANEHNPAKARQQAAYWYIREVAFTYLNRLVGLKCLEVRDLFPEVIQTRDAYGGRSLYHRDYRDAHPELVGQADDGLPDMLAAACSEVTQQVRTLFDPDSDSSIVWPRYDALRRAIALINGLPLDHWEQDEIIGWIYQFYNAEEKEEIRKRGKPTLPIEVAVINQFFTPRWIVKFLVDNTLGRLWLEMHPDSPQVRAICDYLVPEPLAEQAAKNESQQEGDAESSAKEFKLDENSPINNPAAAPHRAAKSPQELRLIDPACGAMHFGYYAFEVFTAIYQDAREQGYVSPEVALDDKDIPLAILRHNLYGVDIDLRAVQLAALALYLKARVALRNAGVSDEQARTLPWQVNLVCADARLPADGMRTQFLQHYAEDKVLQQAWRELFEEMEDIAQVGSLLRVEQRFRSILEQHRPASVELDEQRQGYLAGMEPQTQQLRLADAPEAYGWSPRYSIGTMLDHLKQFARDALETADVNAQLFATEAEKTLGLLDVLMQTYDVVVMNPPYGQALTWYDNNQAKDANNNLYAAFLFRASEILTKDGYIGALTDRSFVLLHNFEGFRSRILHSLPVRMLLDLLTPLPEDMQDLALIDRIHAYVPGWDVDKMRPDYFTHHYGFVVDYFSEVLRAQRKLSYTDAIDRYVRMGSHLNQRDVKAVRKSVSGLIKLLHPDGVVSKSELEEYLTLAMELRRRVKEQLRKMGGFEYWAVNFSYIDQETLQETFVPVQEEGGEGLIATGPLLPGVAYGIAAERSDGRLAIIRLEVQTMRGNGSIRISGAPRGNNALKDALRTAHDYLKANPRAMVSGKGLTDYDLSVQVINVMGLQEGEGIGVAALIAMLGAMTGKSVTERTVILGTMSLHGTLFKVPMLTEHLQLAMDNGARRVLLPAENKRDFADIPSDILDKVQIGFYSDPLNAAYRALGME